jgi:anti-sigma28 factor (negative regulator of flagellin synthesis)
MFCNGSEFLEGPASDANDFHRIPEQPGRKRMSSRKSAPIRIELVERVRRQIANGTYETPEKLEKALGRMFDQLVDD